MYVAFLTELPLGGVPDGVVGLGRFELLHIIQMLAAITGMGFQRLPRPIGQGIKTIVTSFVVTEVVAGLAPGQGLIQKGVDRWMASKVAP